MYCPQCGSALPQDATYCTQCAAVVNPVDHVVKTMTRVTKDVLNTTGQALDRAAKAVEPTVDKAIQVTKEAADKTVKAVTPAVEKVAGATERVARNLKEKAQRRRQG